ncbi:TPA: hypothetical protein O7U53_004132 [Salmonella enterica]|nr:hypothetical protein [Salmonella enterica]
MNAIFCRKIIMLFLIYCSVNSLAWGGGCNLQGAGKWWKGLSVAGINLNVKRVQWNGGVSGNGWYDVSILITMEQGVKNYYSSSTGSSWYRENLPAATLAGDQYNCIEGNVVTATMKNVSVGGGVVIPKISDAYSSVGTTSAQLLNNSGNLPHIAQISTPPGEYMVGVTGSVYSDTWNGKVYISTSGVSDGHYSILIPMGISGVSVWFMTGSNYWDRINGQNTPPPIGTVYLPLTIRISGGRPVDPDISCTTNTVASINHGILQKNVANGHERMTSIDISCNALTSGTIRLIGGIDEEDYTLVRLGNSISSEMSVSTNQYNWKRVINNIPLQSGMNRLYFKSKLQVGDNVQAGMFSGSAIAVLNIN